jgi:hypothetical protein
MYLDINILNSFVKHYFVVCLEKVDIFIHVSRLDWFVKNNKFLVFCVCVRVEIVWKSKENGINQQFVKLNRMDRVIRRKQAHPSNP